ncbi:SGNH/GDSL hydrolase family protein [Saccharothrix sp. HUAS TT1]|uniref:SGNH/GDSL hydrolase family protein n=1 Tax=unclassified Saccharothrix TaxID=2593673 RepID=UPI00345C42AE
MRRLLPALLATFSIISTTAAATAEPDPVDHVDEVVLADHVDQADTFTYVALGDSAAAGPLIPQQDTSAPGCLRSTRNWPAVLAAQLGAELTDVTCSGAVTDDLAGSQETFDGRQAPQADALTPEADLVTITIGGNDVDLVGTALDCVNLLPEPLGTSCRDRLTANGRDRLAEEVDAYATEFADALDLIATKSPEARVVVVGYGTYIQPGGCYPDQPIWGRDSDYLQASIHRLNEVLARESAAHGATFVDIAPPSVGHDACAPARTRWFEGFSPTGPAAPLHPNARGMDAIGRWVADRL